MASFDQIFGEGVMTRDGTGSDMEELEVHD